MPDKNSENSLDSSTFQKFYIPRIYFIDIIA